MFAPVDPTRISIRAQRSLNRVGTTKSERYGSDKQTNNNKRCESVWYELGSAGGAFRRSQTRHNIGRTQWSSSGRETRDGTLRTAGAVFGDGGREKKGLRVRELANERG